MIDEEKLKKRIESKCLEVVYKRELYKSGLEGLESKWKSFKEGWDDLNTVIKQAIDLKDYKTDYDIKRFETKQLCHSLGNEYVEIYNRIVGGAEK